MGGKGMKRAGTGRGGGGQQTEMEDEAGRTA